MVRIEKAWIEPYLSRLEEASRSFIRQMQARIAEEWSISSSQFCLLKILESEPAITVTEVAGRLNMTVAGATGLIDRLVRAGLVLRNRDDADRRVVRTTLSEQGRQYLAGESVRRRTIMAECMEPLSPQEIELLVSLLEKLTQFPAGAGIIKEHKHG